MKFIALAKMIVSLMPILISAIKAAEAAIPESGKGREKLVIVRGTIEAAYVFAFDTEMAFDEVWPSIKKAVDAIVAAFNAAKVFDR